MTKYICLFNHKGGVSKTTTAYHLAWKLADCGKRILMVDTDAQCNLTGLVMGDQMNAYYANPLTCNYNIYESLKDLFSGNATVPSSIVCPSVGTNSRLFILPGHPGIATFDSPLSLALCGGAAFMSQQNQPGALYALIEQCCVSNEIDYVLIDMNPALSSLNKVFFSMCDGFILPTVPDPFCVMALNSLTRVLPAWKQEITNFIAAHPSASLKLPNKTTRFIGEIIQRYSLRNQMPSKSYSPIIDEIKDQIQNSFVPAMQGAGMLFAPVGGASLPVNTAGCIAQMPEFLSLLQTANSLQKPVFAVTDAEIGGGAIFENLRSKRDAISVAYDRIADTILTLLP